MRTAVFTLTVVMAHFLRSASKEIYADEGDVVTFELPSVAKCGNYQFLNPQLSPLIIIKNHSAVAIQGAYVKRTTVYVIDNNNLQLTLENVAPVDRGKYRVYTKSGEVASCSKLHYYLNVRAKVIEYLNPWSAWSPCLPQCGSMAQRTRERNCSIPGGCKGFGITFEVDSCVSSSGCPVWSQWSSWTICDSVCGRGKRTRNRTCSYIDTNAKQLNASCFGAVTQDELCEEGPCKENITFWTQWGPWGPCNLTCGGGYRQRTREAKFLESKVVASFAGWSTDEEQCNTFECEEKESQVQDIVDGVEPGGPSVVALVVSCACVLFIVILLIVILFLIIRLRKKGLNIFTLVQSFRQSRQTNEGKSISAPTIPRKASEPNAYCGVKVALEKNKRHSNILKKDNKRKKASDGVASSMTVPVESISYTKRPKSGKSKSKKTSCDNSNTVMRISAPIHSTGAQVKPENKIVYDTPRSSKSVTEDEIKAETMDIDDTYEIPENPIWDEDIISEGTHTPKIIVTCEPSVPVFKTKTTPTTMINPAETGLPSTNIPLAALNDSCCTSPSSSPGYTFKYPKNNGFSSLYDTPRSSSSNLSRSIYDVPHSNEPLYQNDDFQATDEQFYVTPKTSVSSVGSV